MVLGLAHMARPRVVLELPEMAREGDLLVIGQLLIAEDEYRILVHAGLDRGDRTAIERTAAIDARYLPRKDRMQRTDRYRHRCSSCYSAPSLGLSTPRRI